MITWDEIISNYIIKYNNKIKKATQPLRDHFGIEYFTYHKIDEAGNYTVLVDRPDWAEHYVNEKIYLNDPYLRHPNIFTPGRCLVEEHGSQEYKKTIMREGKAILNLDIMVMIIKKQKNCVEFFGFAANKSCSYLHTLYLKHEAVLNSFSLYFKDQLNPVLKKMEEEDSSLLKMKGHDFLCDQPINAEMDITLRTAFMNDIGLKKEIEMIKALSLRERECLNYFIEEKSAKETAYLLGLSPRTVEYYFENIKNKFSSPNKRELLHKAKKLKDCGLLP